MMWFKRESKTVSEKPTENGVVGKLKRKKGVLLKPTRESSERETSTESEKEKRRYSDILDIKVSQERRDESDESLYESADCHSDAISASDDALPTRLSKTPTMSKESLKLAVTDEEVEVVLRNKKGHRKTMSLSNPLEAVKTLSDDWFDSKKDLEKLSDKKKSKESLFSEEDRDSVHDASGKNPSRKNSKKEDSKSESNSRKSSTVDQAKRKSSKTSSVSALNFLRRKKTPTSILKAVESVVEVADKIISNEELRNITKVFLDEEKRYSSIRESTCKPPVETDSDDEPPTPILTDHRRRLSRQTSRGKSKARGKSQSLKINTLRKSHSGTLKKGKKKGLKSTPSMGRSRQASVVEQTPILKKKSSDSIKHNSWFGGYKGEPRREGSTEETAVVDGDQESDVTKHPPDKDSKAVPHNWRSASGGAGGAGGASRGVNRAESCRERDAPRRGKHRNASDPNRLTALNHGDLEPGAATAPSGSSSSSSLSSRSNESNTVADPHASASDWSDEDSPLAAQWADSLPPRALDTLTLSARLRKRQEVIHELIVSEGSHVRWLKVLGKIFLRPLEAQPSLLPAEELRALFPNLPGVRERHTRLYSELRALRNGSAGHVVHTHSVATALLNTLGDAGYAPCLARFCRGQRMALDALKERRRKNKELHQFLISREQMPLCGRLQLRDLLACVWQRLTKYQLLLESILKTVDLSPVDGAEPDSSEDEALLKRALEVAKEVLQGVDTAIRTAENEHRLRTIQNKLEVRIPNSGVEWEEPKRLDLTQHSLRMEGELNIRNDSNKKMSVLALMLEECLVLLQREGDRFVLKPIPHASQPGGGLSPLVKWERVLFRPNAAVRNAFFLMHINGVQMHELSTNTNSEYHTWARHMSELPLAKPELRPALTPSHQPARPHDDSGINVSRNPSDASEKSTSSAPSGECERESNTPVSAGERDNNTPLPNDDESKVDVKEERHEREEASEREERRPRRPTVGRISTHGADPPRAPLAPPAALTVRPPAAHSAHTAHTALTHHERLRRLDAGISRALRAKNAVVGALLGLPAAPAHYHQLADLAVHDALTGVDSGSGEESIPPDMHALLLAAQAQANQLTEALSAALSVSEAGAVAARAGAGASSGRCDSCMHKPRLAPRTGIAGSTGTADTAGIAGTTGVMDAADGDDGEEVTDLDAHAARLAADAEAALGELLGAGGGAGGGGGGEPPAQHALGTDVTGALLAGALLDTTCGLQATLARLLHALPAHLQHADTARATLAAQTEANHALRARAGIPVDDGYEEIADNTLQDEPSNGG